MSVCDHCKFHELKHTKKKEWQYYCLKKGRCRKAENETKLILKSFIVKDLEIRGFSAIVNIEGL